MAQNRFKISALVVAASWLAGGPALAESAMQQLQGVQQQSDQARRNQSLEGAKQQSGRGIDTKGTYVPPVRANPQPKPSPVGQPINGPGGYKPAPTTLRTTAPPSPVTTRPAVQPRTTTTPQPVRTTTPTPQPTRTTPTRTTSTPPPTPPRPSTYSTTSSSSTYSAPRSTSTSSASSSSSSSRPSSTSSSSSSSSSKK